MPTLEEFEAARRRLQQKQEEEAQSPPVLEAFGQGLSRGVQSPIAGLFGLYDPKAGLAWEQEIARANPARGAAAFLGETAGSILPMIPGAVAAAVEAPVAGALGLGALGYYGLSSAGQGRVGVAEFEQATGEDVGPLHEVLVATGMGAVTLLTERLPIKYFTSEARGAIGRVALAKMGEGIRSRSPRLLKEGAKMVAKDIAAGAKEEGVQEAIEQHLQNIIEKSYNPERGWFEGVGQSALGGAVGGSMLSGIQLGASAPGAVRELSKGNFEERTIELRRERIRDMLAGGMSEEAQTTLFHGTRASFDKLTTEHLHTGAGDTWQGHGVYATEVEEIAEYYAKHGSSTTLDFYNYDLEDTNGEAVLQSLISEAKGIDPGLPDIFDIVAPTTEELQAKLTQEAGEVAAIDGITKDASDFLLRLKEGLDSGELRITDYKRQSSKAYQVTVEDKEWLDWDQPVPEEQKQRILAGTGEHLGRPVQNDWIASEPVTGEQVYRWMSSNLGSDKAASELLYGLGITGNKYLIRRSKDRDYYDILVDGQRQEVSELVSKTITPGQAEFVSNGDLIRVKKLVRNLEKTAANDAGFEGFDEWLTFWRNIEDQLETGKQVSIEPQRRYNYVIFSPETDTNVQLMREFQASNPATEAGRPGARSYAFFQGPQAASRDQLQLLTEAAMNTGLVDSMVQSQEQVMYQGKPANGSVLITPEGRAEITLSPEVPVNTVMHEIVEVMLKVLGPDDPLVRQLLKSFNGNKEAASDAIGDVLSNHYLPLTIWQRVTDWMRGLRARVLSKVSSKALQEHLSRELAKSIEEFDVTIRSRLTPAQWFSGQLEEFQTEQRRKNRYNLYQLGQDERFHEMAIGISEELPQIPAVTKSALYKGAMSTWARIEAGYKRDLASGKENIATPAERLLKRLNRKKGATRYEALLTASLEQIAATRTAQLEDAGEWEDATKMRSFLLEVAETHRKVMSEAGGVLNVQSNVVRNQYGLSELQMRWARDLLASTDDPVEKARIIEQVKQSKMQDYLRSLYINNLLSNPGTHVVNAVTTGFHLLWQLPRMAGISTVEKTISLFNSQYKRHTLMSDILHMAYGSLVYAREGAKNAWEVVRTGEPGDDDTKLAYELPTGIASPLRNWNLSGFPIGTALEMPGRMLMAVDAMLKAIAAGGYARVAANRMLENQEYWHYWPKVDSLEEAKSGRYETYKVQKGRSSLDPTSGKEIAEPDRIYALPAKGTAEREALLRRLTSLEHMPREIRKEAGHMASYATFTRRPAEGSVTRKVLELREATLGWGGKPHRMPGWLLLPFVNTTAQLLKLGMDYTPVAGALWNIPSISRGKALEQKGTGGFKKIKGKQREQLRLQGAKTAAEVFVDQMVGVALTGLLFYLLQDNEEFTGPVPSNAAEREAFYRANKLPYAMKVGDDWISLEKMEPFNLPIKVVLAGADALRRVEAQTPLDPATAEEIFLGVTNSVFDAFASTGFLDALTRAAETLSGGRQLVRNSLRIPSNLVPYSNFWRVAEDLYDASEGGKIVRENDSLLASAMDDLFGGAMPLSSRKLPARINVWGEEVRSDDAWTMLHNWLPLKWRPETSDPVEREFERLGVAPGVPRKTMQFRGEERVIPPPLWRDYAMFQGTLLQRVLTQVVGSKGYRQLGAPARIAVLERVVNRVRSAAHPKLMGQMLKWEREGRGV